MSFFNEILDWSEVWALFIPLSVLMRHKKQPVAIQPVVFYVWSALLINGAIDVIWKFRKEIPSDFNSNNYLYNVHSLVRFYLFSVFFIRLRQPFLSTIKRVIPVLFLLFVIINFSFFEHFFDYYKLSSRLLSMEAGLLLFYCLQYYLYKVKEDLEMRKSQPDFWIVTGLGIYVAINFFIFLLYNELTEYYNSFAVNIWNMHNLSYILLQIFIAKAFYESTLQ